MRNLFNPVGENGQALRVLVSLRHSTANQTGATLRCVKVVGG